MAKARTTAGAISQQPSTQKPWTVMVFMAASDTPALDAFAVSDLREMERGINDEFTNVVVEMNRSWPDTPQRYEIGPFRTGDRPQASTRLIPGGDDEPADERGDALLSAQAVSLRTFVKWARKRYPARYYFLVLWGHSFGLGFGRSHNDALTLTDLRTVLEPQAVDVLGANACAMSYVEAAYELRNCADYLVASQISVPFVGWPYESVLKNVVADTTPRRFGELVVDAYVGLTASASADPVSMSLLDLGQAEGLKRRVSGFADAIREASTKAGAFSSDRLNHMRDIFIGATAGDVRPLIDVVGLCDDLADVDSAPLQKAAGELREFITGSLRIVRKPERADLNGVGIFAPFVTDDADLKRLQLQNNRGPRAAKGGPDGRPERPTGRAAYDALQLFDGGDDSWPTLVYDDLEHELSADVMAAVSSIDPSRLQDRRDVAQIVMAIAAAFNKLDFVLAMGKTHVREKREGAVPELPKPPALAATAFGLPYLRLIQPIDPAIELSLLDTRKKLAALRGEKLGRHRSTGRSTQIGEVVAFLSRVERAIGNVEMTVLRGMTNARFGLGPLGASQTVGAFSSLGLDPPKSGLGLDPPKSGLGLDPPKSGLGLDPPKSGLGLDPPKSGLGLDPPKSGLGLDPPKSGLGLSIPGTGLSGDLRMDLALARVVDLFRQVAEALRALEDAALDAETTARAVMTSAPAREMTAKDLERSSREQISRAFHLLDDASTGARRVVSRVLMHPIYGIGPGSSDLGLEARQMLARAGGLDRRTLRLL